MFHGASRQWARLGIVAFAVLILLSGPGLQAGAASPSQDTVIEVVDEVEPTPSASPSSDATRQAQVDAVVRLSNAERTRVGAPPLQPNESLTRAAQAYAAVLAPGPCFEHTCPPVPALRDRAANAGYSDWERLGENIAAGDPTPESVVAGWMSSPGHRANILKAEYQEIGVGVLKGDGKYRVYWVQVFGTRWQ